jgi:hypothetical protein
MKHVQTIGDKLALPTAGNINPQILQLFQQQRLSDMLVMILIEDKTNQVIAKMATVKPVGELP